MITELDIWQRLKTVIDPELGINVVDLGLVYEVSVSTKQRAEGKVECVHIVYTLTTPGCPLAHVFIDKIQEACRDLPHFDVNKQLTTELVFDPPWVTDMMSEDARNELDFMF